MREVYLYGNNPTYYVKKGDLMSEWKLGLISQQSYEDYSRLFGILDSISDILKIEVPDLAITNTLTAIRPSDGSPYEMSAMVFHPEDIKELSNNLIVLSRKCAKLFYTTGVLAHELRHIYQKKYNPSIVETYAQGYIESLEDEAEIDADAFGIWYLAHTYKISLHKAGSILCPKEKLCNPDSYSHRIERAKEIILEMQ